MAVYILCDRDKKFLREDFGELFSGSDPAKNAERVLEEAPGESKLYVVGDYCAEKILKAGGSPEVIVYDKKVRREHYRGLEGLLKSFNIIKASNSRGEISEEAHKTVKEAIESGKTAVKIDGEEDLLGLSVVDCAEPGTYLAYGDPGISGEEGIRLVEVDAEVKKKVGRMLSR